MARRLKFVNNNFYHLFNRGVMKQNIFLDEKDYARLTELMRWCLRYDYSYSKFLSRVEQEQKTGADPQEVEREIAEHHSLKRPPIEIITWTLMPNHFHIVVKQLIDNGISYYLHRLSSSYSLYFSRKYETSGAVLQGNFKAVWIEGEGQFLHVCRYVHINPLSAKITTRQQLQNYPWSSLKSYISNENDHITHQEPLRSYFKSIRHLTEFTLAPFQDNEVAAMEGIIIDDDFDWHRRSAELKKAQHAGLVERIKAS